MKWIISFDISDDRKRARAVKILKTYAYRVQKSVFEGFFTHEALDEAKSKMKDVIDNVKDSVRYYPLCSNCEEKLEIQGNGKKVEETGYIIL